MSLKKFLTSIEENRKTSEAERDEAIKLRLEMENLKKKIVEKESRISTQRDKLVAEAKNEARAILKKGKR